MLIPDVSQERGLGHTLADNLTGLLGQIGIPPCAGVDSQPRGSSMFLVTIVCVISDIDQCSFQQIKQIATRRLANMMRMGDGDIWSVPTFSQTLN